MNNAIPFLLVLLVVSSLFAVPALAAGFEGDVPVADDDGALQQNALQQNMLLPHDEPLTEVDETTNRLELTSEVRSEYTEYGSDLGMALAATDNELRIDYEQYAIVDSEFEDASNEEREQIVRNGFQQVEERILALEEREERAVVAHSNGELSGTELLQTLLQNHHEAAVLSETLESLEKRTERISGWGLSVDDKQNALEMHRTPIRSTLDTVASDHEMTQIVAIQTSENGYSLSTVGENYVRETTRFDNRADDQTSELDDVSEAFDYTKEELYPWAFEHSSSPSAEEFTTLQLFRVETAHDHGDLEIYLDGRSGDVYREVQELSLATQPVTERETVSDDGLEVAFNETPSNGPVEITVTDAETGEPETATVSVDAFEIGATDTDGIIWLVPPAGSYDLTVETGTNTLETTVPND
ncbi:DUF7096 domain-containing protein [Natronorubrum sp. DTA28]|uniref:DUF7096 domain-containing protein n=1 Tax=Natronorubrum sp. DTA28 TaxID=3447019 RepID=UPI003F877D02